MLGETGEVHDETFSKTGKILGKTVRKTLHKMLGKTFGKIGETLDKTQAGSTNITDGHSRVTAFSIFIMYYNKYYRVIKKKKNSV